MAIKIECWQNVNGKKIFFDNSGKEIRLTEEDIQNGILEEIKVDGQKYYVHEEKGEYFYYNNDNKRINLTEKQVDKLSESFLEKSVKKVGKFAFKKAVLQPTQSINAILKQRVKQQIQHDLLYERNTENKLYETIKLALKKGFDIVLTLTGTKVIYKGITWGIAALFLVVNAFMAQAEAENSSVDTSFEGKETQIIEEMAQLDSQCGSKLTEGFAITGDAEGDWKTVLSLYMGCYDSEISEVSGTYVSAIEQAAATYGVDKWLICGVIMTESSWIFHEPNQYGAAGFMQVTPVCAADMNYDYEQVKTDPYANIMCGVGYLRKMIDSCHGDTILGLAAYNSGLGNVQKYGWSVPPYKETQDYVKKVPQYARYYESGTWHIPDGTVAMDTDLSRFYWAVNKVESSSTLKRNTLEEAMQELNFNEDQIDVTEDLFEADSWELFDTDEEYAYNIKAAAVSGFPGIQFITGDRPSGQAIIDHAMTQLGNVGGQPYWSYYGFNSRVAWCGCFVNWCMRTEPTNAGASYPTAAQTGNNAYCPTLVTWFKRSRRWADRGFTNLVAGDVIFFDWEQDGTSDHVGLVVGRDENYIYTIEGNSSDMVRTKQYGINSPSIQGYGLMQY